MSRHDARKGVHVLVRALARLRERGVAFNEDGEFLCEDTFGTLKGVGGGNFLILGESQAQTLAAAEAAVAASAAEPGDADTIARREPGHAAADLDDTADNLVSRYDR